MLNHGNFLPELNPCNFPHEPIELCLAMAACHVSSVSERKVKGAARPEMARWGFSGASPSDFTGDLMVIYYWLCQNSYGKRVIYWKNMGHMVIYGR